MNVFEAKQLRLDCIDCKTRKSVEVNVALNREEECGFDVLGCKCASCGSEIPNEEGYTAAELLGA